MSKHMHEAVAYNSECMSNLKGSENHIRRLRSAELELHNV